MSFINRLQHGWNAFIGRDPTPRVSTFPSSTVYGGPPRNIISSSVDRSVITSRLTRIAVDVASVSIAHARLDDESRYKQPMNSELNQCLTLAANSDQTARAFLQDAAMSLLTEGVIAIVPTEATANPMLTEGYDIGALRVGKVVKWYPKHVTVNLYNEDTGERVDRTFPKAMVALPENPFYEIMNRPNSTYQRLIQTLRQLDQLDGRQASDKLDLIIQVPYTARSELQKARANGRREELVSQLSGSRYGIAYIDGSEKVIQLNRAVENNLFNRVEYYTNMLSAELGMPASVFDGTADEATMLNYQNRIIEPIISALVDSMKWKFLSRKARGSKQSIVFFKDPFRLSPIEKIADVADKFTRNAILSANELRQIVGFRPSEDPEADRLKNANLNQDRQQVEGEPPVPEEDNEEPQS